MLQKEEPSRRQIKTYRLCAAAVSQLPDEAASRQKSLACRMILLTAFSHCPCLGASQSCTVIEFLRHVMSEARCSSRSLPGSAD